MEDVAGITITGLTSPSPRHRSKCLECLGSASVLKPTRLNDLGILHVFLLISRSNSTQPVIASTIGDKRCPSQVKPGPKARRVFLHAIITFILWLLRPNHHIEFYLSYSPIPPLSGPVIHSLQTSKSFKSYLGSIYSAAAALHAFNRVKRSLVAEANNPLYFESRTSCS